MSLEIFLEAIIKFIIKHEVLLAVYTLGGLAAAKSLHETYKRESYATFLTIIIVCFTLIPATYFWRDRICDIIRCGQQNNTSKLEQEVAALKRQIMESRRSSQPSQADIDALNQRLSSLEQQRANASNRPPTQWGTTGGGNESSSTSNFHKNFVDTWGRGH